MKKRFEYFKYTGQTDISQEDMNQRGEHGWELVSHSHTSGLHGTKFLYVFKREISIEDRTKELVKLIKDNCYKEEVHLGLIIHIHEIDLLK